jgi:membrane peptidoglycan carboxypeptidase
MAHGRVTRSVSRYPDARRRAQRYGKTRYGQKSRHLPPNLLPGVTGRGGIKSQFLGGPIGILTIVAAALGVAAILFIIVTAISATIGVIGTMRAYKDVNADLPNAAAVVADTFQTTKIYDRNGNLLQEVDNPDASAGWRTYVSMEAMPDDFINATIAAEDATFWTNEGVEPVAIVRGAFINVSGSGS